MPDFATLAGVVTSLVTAAGALTARLAANRRELRVRNSLENNLKFAKELSELNIPNLERLKENLAAVVDSDIDALSRIIERRNEEKYRNYASLLMAIFLGAVTTIPLWFLWRPQSVWTWLIFIVIGVIAALVLIAGLFACFKDPGNTAASS